jgi:hypothetical protein
MKTNRILDTDVTVSFRAHPHAGDCCYVTVAHLRERGQREIVFSRHVTGSPERLVDDALKLARQLALEFYLGYREPF